MRILLIAVAAAALAGSPAYAQKHDPHPPDVPAKPVDVSKMSPEEMRQRCAMMDGKKEGHDASALTDEAKAQMKAMHEKCTAMKAGTKKEKPKGP